MDLLLLGPGRENPRLRRLVELLHPSCEAGQAACWLRDDPDLFDAARRQNVAAIIAHRYWPELQRELPEDLLARWRSLLMSAAIVPMHRRAEARTCLAALVDAGATPVVMRGLWLGEALYPEPGLRPHTDMDLLVPLDRLNEALDALSGLGYAPVDPLPVDLRRLKRLVARGIRSDFSGVCRPGANGLQLSVDLHYALSVVAYGWWPWVPSPQEVYERSIPWDFHGVSVRCHDPAMALLSLCENVLRHALAREGRGNWLIRFYDIALLCGTLSPVDWEVFAADALQFRLNIPCGLALSTVQANWGTPLPEGLLDRLLTPRVSVAAARYALSRPVLAGLHGRNAMLYSACTGSFPGALAYLARNAGPGIADVLGRVARRITRRSAGSESARQPPNRQH
ncbi:MAG: nucleotidyltransferase family protein [Armatimonadetes bacterium]|nr:nucleotidyltransferase family protein [Armatimonadota bacterium]